MANTGETPRSVELGLLIRRFRIEAGLTQSQLASRMGKTSHSEISRWESGKIPLPEKEAAALIVVCGVSIADRERIFGLIHDAADPNWLTTGVDKQLALLREYENRATRIVTVYPLLVPGLLQTRDYSIALMTGAGASRGDAENWTDFRMARRDVITHKDGVEYLAIIGDHAIKRPFCTPDIALGQLQQLLDLGRLGNVTIQILPLDRGYSPALEGSFDLIEAERFKTVVHVEHYWSSTTLTDAKDVRAYMLAAEDVRRAAMTPASTMDLIQQIYRQMEKSV